MQSCSKGQMLLTRYRLASTLHSFILIEQVGQLDMDWHSHNGPFHQSVEDLIAKGDIPLEMRSAGLSLVETYCQVAPVTCCWIVLIRLATGDFHLWGSDFIQDKTTLELENKFTSLAQVLKALETVLASLVNNKVAHNLCLGLEITSNGAALGLEVHGFTISVINTSSNGNACSICLLTCIGKTN